MVYNYFYFLLFFVSALNLTKVTSCMSQLIVWSFPAVSNVITKGIGSDNSKQMDPPVMLHPVISLENVNSNVMRKNLVSGIFVFTEIFVSIINMKHLQLLSCSAFHLTSLPLLVGFPQIIICSQ